MSQIWSLRTKPLHLFKLGTTLSDQPISLLMTATGYSTAALIGNCLYLKGKTASAYLLWVGGTQGWRFESDMLSALALWLIVFLYLDRSQVTAAITLCVDSEHI